MAPLKGGSLGKYKRSQKKKRGRFFFLHVIINAEAKVIKDDIFLNSVIYVIALSCYFGR